MLYKKAKIIIENKCGCLATVYAASVTGNRSAFLLKIVKILIQLLSADLYNASC